MSSSAVMLDIHVCLHNRFMIVVEPIVVAHLGADVVMSSSVAEVNL